MVFDTPTPTRRWRNQTIETEPLLWARVLRCWRIDKRRDKRLPQKARINTIVHHPPVELSSQSLIAAVNAQLRFLFLSLAIVSPRSWSGDYFPLSGELNERYIYFSIGRCFSACLETLFTCCTLPSCCFSPEPCEKTIGVQGETFISPLGFTGQLAGVARVTGHFK